jgi:hypothetical protein
MSLHPLPSHTALDDRLSDVLANLPSVPTEPIAVRYTRLVYILGKLDRDHEAAKRVVLEEMEAMRLAYPTLAVASPVAPLQELSPSTPTLTLGEIIIEAVEVAVQKHGSISKAAKLLGIERTTLRRILAGDGAYNEKKRPRLPEAPDFQPG